MLSGVFLVLLLRSSAVGAHTACPLCALIAPSARPCCCMNMAFAPETGAAPGRKLE